MITSAVPWVASRSLDERSWTVFRRQAIFACHKWDHQVEDVATIARGPLVLRRDAWRDLQREATALAGETLALERALRQQPSLWRHLGIARPLRQVLAHAPAGDSVRFMRFDFHWTTDGWQVSEVNADVPGGFNEAAIGALMAPLIGGCRPVGDPASGVAHALAQRCAMGSTVALLHATAYSDDRQVMEFVGESFAAVGLRAQPCAPDHLRWNDSGCLVDEQPIAAILRFFPGEWLPALPRDCAWRHLAGHPRVVLANPVSALLVQSKRLPLVWDRLDTECPTWRRLLPPTSVPRAARYGRDPAWVLKPAFGRVGDGVAIDGVTSPQVYRSATRSAWWFPGHWLAQRRFASIPWNGPGGPCHVCIGVYTVDGTVVGAYGRYAPTPLIDHRAVDVPVLVEEP